MNGPYLVWCSSSLGQSKAWTRCRNLLVGGDDAATPAVPQSWKHDILMSKKHKVMFHINKPNCFPRQLDCWKAECINPGQTSFYITVYLYVVLFSTHEQTNGHDACCTANWKYSRASLSPKNKGRWDMHLVSPHSCVSISTAAQRAARPIIPDQASGSRYPQVPQLQPMSTSSPTIHQALTPDQPGLLPRSAAFSNMHKHQMLCKPATERVIDGRTDPTSDSLSITWHNLRSLHFSLSRFCTNLPDLL